MNHFAEVAFKQWLESEGIAIKINTGLDGDQIENQEQVVIITVGESEVAVNPLNRMSLEVSVSTPAFFNSGDKPIVALTAHSSLFKTIRDLLEDYSSTQLASIYKEVTGDRFAGSFFEGESTTQQDSRWVSVARMMFGSDKRG